MLTVCAQLNKYTCRVQAVWRGRGGRHLAYLECMERFRRVWHPVARRFFYFDGTAGTGSWSAPLVLKYLPVGELPARTADSRRAAEAARTADEDRTVAESVVAELVLLHGRLLATEEAVRSKRGARMQERHIAVRCLSAVV